MFRRFRRWVSARAALVLAASASVTCSPPEPAASAQGNPGTASSSETTSLAGTSSSTGAAGVTNSGSSSPSGGETISTSGSPTTGASSSSSGGNGGRERAATSASRDSNTSDPGDSTHTGGTTGAGGSAQSAGNAATSSNWLFPPEVSKPRIMIVGDSISAGPGCYKKYLVQNLVDHQITNYEFVGEYDDDCGGGVRHSAVSCTTSDQYTQATFTVPNCFGSDSFPGMSTLVQTHDPDLILLQLGVNDVWSGNAAIEPILNNYATLVEQARIHNPNIVLVVAQTHRIVTDNCQNTASTSNAEQLVMAVPGWAESISTSVSPVLVADLWTNSDPSEADDCVHPTDAGAKRMGLNWYNALKNILE